jgi:hypothetical protein
MYHNKKELNDIFQNTTTITIDQKIQLLHNENKEIVRRQDELHDMVNEVINMLSKHTINDTKNEKDFNKSKGKKYMDFSSLSPTVSSLNISTTINFNPMEFYDRIILIDEEQIIDQQLSNIPIGYLKDFHTYLSINKLKNNKSSFDNAIRITMDDNTEIVFTKYRKNKEQLIAQIAIALIYLQSIGKKRKKRNNNTDLHMQITE